MFLALLSIQEVIALPAGNCSLIGAEDSFLYNVLKYKRFYYWLEVDRRQGHQTREE